MRRPLVVAHRCGSAVAPENTHTAAELEVAMRVAPTAVITDHVAAAVAARG
jgi:hypothetical protein